MSLEGSASVTGDLANSISNWLKDRREQLAARAMQHGLPFSVTVQVPVADFTGNGGIQITSESRQQSPFAFAGSFHPMLFKTITKPLIDAQGERLAAMLVEQFGEQVKYPCNLGPGFVQQDLEHPEIITKLAAPAAEPANLLADLMGWEPIFYALVVLRQCLYEYLASLPTLGADDDAISQRLSQEVVHFLQCDAVTHVGRVPLGGVQTKVEEVCVEDCTLRHLSREERGYLFWQRQNVMWQPARIALGLPATMSPEMWLQERVVLEVRACQPKADVFFNVGTRCQKVLLALHLLGIDFAGAGFGAMLREPQWLWSAGQSVYPLLMPKRSSQDLTSLTEDDLRSALALVDLIPDAAVATPTSPMELSIHRVALAMARSEPTEALVDYTVALEALLLGGTEIGEARRRFAINGAVYLSSSSHERRRLYQQLSRIYGARSVLVHGVSPSERRARKVLASIASIRDEACEIVRKSVRKALTSGWPSETDFIDALLDDVP